MAFWRKKDDGRGQAQAGAQQATPEVSRIGSEVPSIPPVVSPTPPVDVSAAQATKSPPASVEMSPDAKRKAAETSRAVMTAFGQITSVLMRTQHYRQSKIADLEWLVVPALTTGQFSLAEAHSRSNGISAPVGVVLWASVSPEVDARLAASQDVPVRLNPNEWKSGDIIWVVDAVGEPQTVQAMLRRMAEKDWRGRQVKMKARDQSGVLRVGRLAAAPPAP